MTGRVLYIDPQSYGNLSIYDYSLLSNLNADVSYVCSKFYDYKDLPEHIHPVPLFGYSRLKRRWQQVLSYLLSSLHVFCLIMHSRPEIIHVQWLKMPLFEYYLYKSAKRITHARLIFTAHNILPHDSGTRYVKVYRKWYNLVDSIIVHTEDTKQQLMVRFHLNVDKISVIPHGILKIEADEQEVHQVEKSIEKRYKLENKFVLSSLGYQNIYKGVDLIAEAWASTPELVQNMNCQLLFIGKNRGVDFSTLKKLKNVIIEDRYVSNDEFLALMRRSDVSLMTYRQISQSGALLTALAEKTPVLVSQVGGLTEPLQVAKVGWIVSDLTIENVRASLLYLVSHQDEVRAVKKDEQGWAKINQAYDWKTIADATLQLYRKTRGCVECSGQGN